jgi:hypothetical protein
MISNKDSHSHYLNHRIRLGTLHHFGPLRLLDGVALFCICRLSQQCVVFQVELTGSMLRMDILTFICDDVV